MFVAGFAKVAMSHAAHKAAVIGGGAAILGGLGALTGHDAHVAKKILHARHGKDYKEKTFVDRHPKMTGALSLGLLPAISAATHAHKLQREADSKNPKVQKVIQEHPVTAARLGV